MRQSRLSKTCATRSPRLSASSRSPERLALAAATRRLEVRRRCARPADWTALTPDKPAASLTHHLALCATAAMAYGLEMTSTSDGDHGLKACGQ